MRYEKFIDKSSFKCMPFNWSGVVGGGLSLLGDAIGMGVQVAENEKNRQWAEKMRDYENEYNSPKQQIARLKEAGLNPALIYQQGAGSMTSASAPSPSNAGRPLGKLDFRSAFDAYQDAQLKDQQLEGLDLANQHQQILNDIANEDLEHKRRENRKGAFEESVNKWAADMNLTNLQIANLKQSIEKQQAEIDLLNQQYSFNIDKHKWDSDANYRANKRLELEQNANARAQADADYLARVRRESLIDGKTFESMMNDLKYNYEKLSLDEKKFLHDTGFDITKPPKSLYEFGEWVKRVHADNLKDLQQYDMSIKGLVKSDLLWNEQHRTFTKLFGNNPIFNALSLAK